MSQEMFQTLPSNLELRFVQRKTRISDGLIGGGTLPSSYRVLQQREKVYYPGSDSFAASPWEDVPLETDTEEFECFRA